jgi:hypothetical protein
VDQHRIERLRKALLAIPSRRDVLRGFAAMGLGLGIARAPGFADAKKKRKHKKRKVKKPKLNAFGCLNVGAACQSEEQCCSGICAGRQGKRTCRAHHVGPCTAEFDGCRSLAVGCGAGGFCFRTTGQASFCGGQGGRCKVCARDADCVVDHGPGAACVVCDDCDGIDGSKGTVCYPAAPDMPPGIGKAALEAKTGWSTALRLNRSA